MHINKDNTGAKHTKIEPHSNIEHNKKSWVAPKLKYLKNSDTKNGPGFGSDGGTGISSATS